METTSEERELSGAAAHVQGLCVSDRGVAESRFRKFAQDDKWNFCLTADTLCPANQERP
jgi:hypothetical protein